MAPWVRVLTGAELMHVPHGIILKGKVRDGVGPGLQITESQFAGGSIYYEEADSGVAVAPAAANPADVVPVVVGSRISGNYFGPATEKDPVPAAGVGSQCRRSITQRNATLWNFDFCDALVFKTIRWVSATISAAAGVPRYVTRPPNGCKVTVETDGPVTGTVSVSVDSSIDSPEFV